MENYGWSLDAFIVDPNTGKQKWLIVQEGRGSKDGAISYCNIYALQHFPPCTHYHVWMNGDCIYDSHEGQAEPENEK